MTFCSEGSPVGWSRGGGDRITLSGRVFLGKKAALGGGSVF